MVEIAANQPNIQQKDIAIKIGEEIGFPVIVPDDSIYTGALGAALLAWDWKRENREK